MSGTTKRFLVEMGFRFGNARKYVEAGYAFETDSARELLRVNK